MIRSRRLGASVSSSSVPIDAHAEAADRGHAVLERTQEVLVERVRLVAEHLLHLLLQLELRSLLDRVGELAEGSDQLETRRDQVEVLREAGVVAVRPRERRHLAREVAHERRLLDRAFDELLEQLLHDLARAPARLDVRRRGDRRRRRGPDRSSATGSPTASLTRPEDRDASERRREVDRSSRHGDLELAVRRGP